MTAVEEVLEEGLPFPAQSLEAGDGPSLVLATLQAPSSLLGTCQKLLSGLKGSWTQVTKSSSTGVTQIIAYLDVGLW